MRQQVILLIFILICLYFINNKETEPFRNRSKEKYTNRRKEKYTNKKKKKYTNTGEKQKKNNKDDTNNVKSRFGIPGLFNNIISGSSGKKAKILNEINEREKKRHKIILHKNSKNVGDVIGKFNLLKEGLYDIISVGELAGNKE